MSLRVRLTLLYTTLLGGTLLLFGSLVYGLVSLVLLNQVDTLLDQQSSNFIRILRVDSSGQYDTRQLDSFQTTDNNLVFQIWGTNRKLQFARPRSWEAPLDPLAYQVGVAMYNTTFSQGSHMRVISVPLLTQRGGVGMLQVGVALTLFDTTLQALATVLVVLAILSMFIAASIAGLVINRALAPLATATQIATTITKADDLSRRIPVSEAPDTEIGQLIQAFNATLSRLESLFNTQRRFVADVSHELRTPLTVIKGEVSLMRKIGEIDIDSLDSIEMEVDRLTRLVGNLLLLAQAESGRLPLDLKPVELDTVLLEVFHQIRTLAGEKVILQINEIDQVAVVGDRDRLKQVLLNLVSNAVQYTPAGGTVTLSLSKTEERARITVSDTGPGIPPNDLPHIFERFYRGEKSRVRTQGTGFGLGLSIAYWIVRNHNGSIDVTSLEGQGTTFIVLLPFKQPQAQS
ncbi:MAG: HAMP domain-containing protein [Anaerolineae bacterium]|nr:HAMP domain-containing protein [Anaerolineae bacterium]